MLAYSTNIQIRGTCGEYDESSSLNSVVVWVGEIFFVKYGTRSKTIGKNEIT